MRLSILLPTNRPLLELQHEATCIEQAGMSGIWVPDHLSGGTFFPKGGWKGSLTTLATLAHATSTIRLGLLVAGTVLRPAATLAIELGTLQGDGRDILCGIGRGAERDASCTGRSLATSSELYTYALTVTRQNIPVVVAANGPKSLASALRIGGGWVTTGGYGLTGREKEEAVRSLLDTWRMNSGGDTYLLVDPFEPSPWASQSAFEKTIESWDRIGIDELVLWDPASYSTPPVLSYGDAASILGIPTNG